MLMTPDELQERVDVLEDALRWISTHVATTEDGARRMQLVAVDAIMNSERPEQSLERRRKIESEHEAERRRKKNGDQP